MVSDNSVYKQGHEFNKSMKFVYFYHKLVNIPGDVFFNKTMKCQQSIALVANLLNLI